jgi:hypothetical protein
VLNDAGHVVLRQQQQAAADGHDGATAACCCDGCCCCCQVCGLTCPAVSRVAAAIADNTDVKACAASS